MTPACSLRLPAAKAAKAVTDKAYEEATYYRVGGEGDSSRAHSLPDGHRHHLVHGLRTVLKETPLTQTV